MNKKTQKILCSLGIKDDHFGCSSGSKWFGSGEIINTHSPVDGKSLFKVISTSKNDYEIIIKRAKKAFKTFRKIPAPKRGDLIRQLGSELRNQKENLAKLTSYEMGKSLQEGLGEVQEMIDICDYSVGLSRQLNGLTMHSERPLHRMYDQYHPLGIVGIISAFNFPVAVWSWNITIALICGNVCVWKPSEKTPLCSIACQKIIANVLKKNKISDGVSSLINGDYNVGEWMSNDNRIPLISATGSTKMGKKVSQIVAKRLGKTLLELGGNNAVIITPSADIKMTLIAVLFGAIGTCGQRCTSTRRLIIHEDIYIKLVSALKKAYKQIKIGDPLDEKNHMGPLIDKNSVLEYLKAIDKADKERANWIIKGKSLTGKGYESECYVTPSIAEVDKSFSVVQTETFSPILYLIKYSGNIENAIKIQNDVPQGLSSSIMTQNIKESETFLSHWGSDCGIANVNIGTSGAEIGGAFGGEKDTGGGRESGSDAWKTYMRRQTNTINYSSEIPLAQGIKFDI